jgi:HD superfamily phosphodiesterase
MALTQRDARRCAVRAAGYADVMTTLSPDPVAPWVARAPGVPVWWFRRESRLHGTGHTRRVHVHAQRLLELLRWHETDARLVLQAALWHDIGRETDGVEPAHGARGAARAEELGLVAELDPHDAALVRFAIIRHSLPDPGAAAYAHELAADADPARRLADPQRALRVLWVLKDADALDRVRLGFGERADPRQLRHPEAIDQIGFADQLYTALA